MARRAPKQKPGKSEQVVETPREFLEAVEARFGPIDIDLACTRDNRVVERGIFFPENDALSEDFPWRRYEDWNCWLNPEFANVHPWVEKAARESRYLKKGRIFVLAPASVGANWFARHVHGAAMVLFLEQRLKFVGHSCAYPKDLVLICYGQGLKGFDRWDWESWCTEETRKRMHPRRRR